MTAFLLIFAVLLAVAFAMFIPNEWRFELVPVFAGVFMGLYSFLYDFYIPLPFGGEMEAGYFLCLGLWPLLGYIAKTGRAYLYRVTFGYTAGIFVIVFAVAASTATDEALVALLGAGCWLASFAVYWALMRKARWSITRHLFVATAAAVVDLAVYFVGGHYTGIDQISDPALIYGSNLALLLVCVPTYSIPLAWVPATDPPAEPIMTISPQAFRRAFQTLHDEKED